MVGGTWSITSPTLAAGSHSLTATQTDLAGNVSTAATYALAIDTTAPAAASIPALSIGSDSGVVGDHITNVTTPAITGTGIDGDVVTLYDGTTAIGTATVTNGTWTITAPGLSDGVHNLHDTQTSPAGNVSAASPTLALTIDTATPATPAAPALSTSSDSGVPGDDITDVTDPVIDGTGTTGDTIALYDGTTLLGTATVAPGTWTLATGVLAPGLHHLHSVQASPAGNASAASATLGLTIDTAAPAAASAPALSIGSDSGVVGDGITNVTTPVITGTGIDGDVVTLYDGTTAIGTATVTGGT